MYLINVNKIFNIILSISFCLITSISYAQNACIDPTISHYPVVRDIWHKELALLPKEYRKITLVIATQDDKDYKLTMGAESSIGQIIIGCKLVNRFINEPEQLAFTLGHELGHTILGHNFLYKSSPIQESDADFIGLFFSRLLGYDCDKIVQSEQRFEDWRRQYYDKNEQNSHGKAQDRVDNLNFQCKILRGDL